MDRTIPQIMGTSSLELAPLEGLLYKFRLSRTSSFHYLFISVKSLFCYRSLALYYSINRLLVLPVPIIVLMFSFASFLSLFCVAMSNTVSLVSVPLLREVDATGTPRADLILRVRLRFPLLLV
jgi:hypothetical protein